MRCATCGTDNAPDSRFCGGCGARMGPPEQRLAPTAKIPDDATYAPPVQQHAPAAQRGPISYGPAALPPPVQAQMPPPMMAPPAAIPTPMPAPMPTPVPRPASIPPTSARPASSPTAQRPVRHTPPAQRSIDESIVAPPKRPIALIAIVVIIDLGLAAAGAVMLMKGLS